MNTSHLLTAYEAADKLRMLSARVIRLAKAGRIPCVVLPDGEYRFDASDLEAWVQEHKRPAAAESAEGNSHG